MIAIIQKLYYSKLRINIQHRYCGKIPNNKNDNISLGLNRPTDCEGQVRKWPINNRIQYKFNPEVESAFNQQINIEFDAFYNYLSMASYFGRVDVALPGCESFFTQMHNEERDHALQILNFVKMRGGFIKLHPISAPINQDWKCPLHAFNSALELEIAVVNKLYTIIAIAEKHGDLNACDFIVTKFMENQMKSINELAKFVTVLSGI
ncbi:hypothetical protein PV327_011657, partial [Microctonus hyperodae]